MSVKHKVADLINSMLNIIDVEIVRKSKMDKLRKETGLFSKPSLNKSPLPKETEAYLQPDNPRLKELKWNYLSLRHPTTDHSLWTDKYVGDQVNLRFFRSDSAYVWQFRKMNPEIKYLLTTYYVKTIDKLGLLNVLEEDDLFGVHVFNFNDELTISRDLLDSIVQIYFLDQALGISGLSKINILDIGAGYGRLAYRMVKSLLNIGKVFCVDSVAESTFICEYYLRFRGVDRRAIVVPLYEIENTLANNTINIATNVHSFSECTLASITWWLDILKNYKIRYLMIVPNAGNHGGTKLLTIEKDGRRLDFLPAINSRGYKLIAKQPKYMDPSMQTYGMYPTYHYLFEQVI